MFIYTAYLDESGTHAGSPAMTMGGILARADQWKAFQKGFERIKREHGFRVWHTVKFKAKKGDFKGWTDDQCMNLMRGLQQLTSFGLTDTVVFTLDNDSFKNDYRGDGPQAGQLGSAYGLCFRMCLVYFFLQMLRRKHRGKFPELHLVLEAGHRNAGDAQRIFREEQNQYGDLSRRVLKSFKLAEKDESDALMMADFVAHSSLMVDRRVRAGSPGPATIPWNAKLPHGVNSIHHFGSTPAGLANIRAKIIELQSSKKTKC